MDAGVEQLTGRHEVRDLFMVLFSSSPHCLSLRCRHATTTWSISCNFASIYSLACFATASIAVLRPSSRCNVLSAASLCRISSAPILNCKSCSCSATVSTASSSSSSRWTSPSSCSKYRDSNLVVSSETPDRLSLSVT